MPRARMMTPVSCSFFFRCAYFGSSRTFTMRSFTIYAFLKIHSLLRVPVGFPITIYAGTRAEIQEKYRYAKRRYEEDHRVDRSCKLCDISELKTTTRCRVPCSRRRRKVKVSKPQCFYSCAAVSRQPEPGIHRFLPLMV